jgi:hypothetical protein
MSYKYLIVATAVAALASPALSAEKAQSYPNISGEVGFELQNNAAYSSDVATNESNNLTAKVVPVINVRFTPELSLNTELTFEQVQEPAFPGEDQFFDNQGLYKTRYAMSYKTMDLYVEFSTLFVSSIDIEDRSFWCPGGAVEKFKFVNDFEKNELIDALVSLGAKARVKKD